MQATMPWNFVGNIRGGVGERGSDGRDADSQEIAQRLLPEIERVVAAIPVPQNGKDADPEVVRGLVASEIEKAVSGLPKAQDGKDGRDGRDAEIPPVPDDVAAMVTRALMFAAQPMPTPERMAPDKPELHVSIQNNIPRKGTERTVVTKHDDKGRILEFQRVEE